MSGIVGIVNFDGAPVDRALLGDMTDYLAFRGPDRQAIWHQGWIGFGHSTLRTTVESQGESQPESLDGRVWITADARIDGRDELRSKLTSMGHCNISSDGQLILHAYAAWGIDCLDHLIGDFAFAIWDDRRQQLFCGRDHLGFKPFYFAQLGSTLVFSNTLNCVRLHPRVSDKLSDHAIGDFLLFGLSFQTSATTFHDIQRLPAAHCLVANRDGIEIKRYWSMPTNGVVRYRNANDYVDRFKALLRRAVQDRLRTDRVAVLMSGGLDSTSLAALVCDLPEWQSSALQLRAHTIVYDKLFACTERYFATLMAQARGLPIDYLVADDYTLYERWQSMELHTPEPAHYPLLAIYADHYRQVAAHCRVALVGDGGDPLLCPPLSRFKTMLRHGRLLRLLGEVGGYAATHHGKLPPLGYRAAIKHWLGFRSLPRPAFPTWLNADFVARAGLLERWRAVYAAPPMIHPQRPEAYQKLSAPYWPGYFESLDPGMTSFALEIRSPFFDVRLIDFLLAIPPIPWSVDKELLRRAMHGSLPEPIRLRPKTPLAGDPTFEVLRRPESAWINQFDATPELAEFVDRGRIPPIFPVQESDRASYYLKLMPLSLNYWITNSKRVQLDRPRRPKHGIGQAKNPEKISAAAANGLR